MIRPLALASAAAALLAALALVAAPPARPAAPPVAEDDRRDAEACVRTFLAVIRHLHASGDPRFAERLPATPELTQEVVAGVGFGRHAGRAEDLDLVRADVTAVSADADGGLEVRTREYWVVRTRPLDEGPTPVLARPEVHPDVQAARYVLQRSGAGWIVADWGLASDGGR